MYIYIYLYIYIYIYFEFFIRTTHTTKAERMAARITPAPPLFFMSYMYIYMYIGLTLYPGAGECYAIDTHALSPAKRAPVSWGPPLPNPPPPHPFRIPDHAAHVRAACAGQRDGRHVQARAGARGRRCHQLLRALRARDAPSIPAGERPTRPH